MLVPSCLVSGNVVLDLAPVAREGVEPLRLQTAILFARAILRRNRESPPAQSLESGVLDLAPVTAGLTAARLALLRP